MKKAKKWRLEARVFATVEFEGTVDADDAEGVVYETLLAAVTEYLDRKGDVTVDIFEPAKRASKSA